MQLSEIEEQTENSNDEGGDDQYGVKLNADMASSKGMRVAIAILSFTFCCARMVMQM